MARLTNEHLHSEIKLVKQEVEYIKDNQARMQEDLNKNTAFRKSAQRTLWSLWIVLIGILGKMIFWD